MSPLASIITPEPICCPRDVVTASSTTAGSIFAMAASCCVSMVFALDEEPFDCACEVDDVVTADGVVPVLPWLLVNCQPANRPTPKMAAITSVRSTIATVRPARLRGFCGGPAGGSGPIGYLGGWDASCTGQPAVAG